MPPTAPEPADAAADPRLTAGWSGDGNQRQSTIRNRVEWHHADQNHSFGDKDGPATTVSALCLRRPPEIAPDAAVNSLHEGAAGVEVGGRGGV